MRLRRFCEGAIHSGRTRQDVGAGADEAREAPKGGQFYGGLSQRTPNALFLPIGSSVPAEYVGSFSKMVSLSTRDEPPTPPGGWAVTRLWA
jgi:hypothetical protein